MSTKGSKTLHDLLVEASKSKLRVRLVGAPMTILAEGFIAYVGDGVLAIKHQEKEEPDEFILESCVVKMQILAEYRQM